MDVGDKVLVKTRLVNPEGGRPVKLGNPKGVPREAKILYISKRWVLLDMGKYRECVWIEDVAPAKGGRTRK